MVNNNVYCFNLDLSSAETQLINNNFRAHSEDIEVYKNEGSVYAEFCANSEKEIDCMLEEAYNIVLFYYPELLLEGAAFEEKPE